MTYRVTYLQACEPDLLEPAEGIVVVQDPDVDSMGMPRVTVYGPTRWAVQSYVRREWGDDDRDWFREYVTDRIELVEACENPNHDHDSEGVVDSGRHETTCFTRLDRAVMLAKVEVLLDVALGRVPIDVPGFSELHDYVDANEYGGLCDPRIEGSEQWEDNDAWIDFGNALQNRVHDWIKKGGLR
jgi:hypothetical protein